MPVVSTWTQRRLRLYMLSQHPQMPLNFKSSLAWWHTSAPLSVACPLWPLLCKNSWKEMLTSPEMRAMRPLFSKSSKPLSVTPPQILQPITACDHTSRCLKVGLGAALLQDNKSIAFASKALTDAECTYTNIEMWHCGIKMPQSQVHWDIPDTYWAWLAGYLNRIDMNTVDTICYHCLYSPK